MTFLARPISEYFFTFGFIIVVIGILFYRWWGRWYRIPSDQFLMVMQGRFIKFVVVSVRLAFIPRPEDVIPKFPWYGFQDKEELVASTRDGLKLTFKGFLITIEFDDVQKSIKTPSFDNDKPGISAQQILIPLLRTVRTIAQEEISSKTYMLDMYNNGVVPLVGPVVIERVADEVSNPYGVRVKINWGDVVLDEKSQQIIEQYRDSENRFKSQRQQLRIDAKRKELYGPSTFHDMTITDQVMQGLRDLGERVSTAIGVSRPDTVSIVFPTVDLPLNGHNNSGKEVPDNVRKEIQQASADARNQALVLRPARKEPESSEVNNAKSKPSPDEI